jgi:hypothetical protein
VARVYAESGCGAHLQRCLQAAGDGRVSALVFGFRAIP